MNSVIALVIHLLQTTVVLPGNLPSLSALGWALLVSVVYGLTGFVGNQPKETFNKAMFIKTILISVVVAFVLAFSGIDPQTGYAATAVFVSSNTVLMAYIDQVVNDLTNISGSIKIVVASPPAPAKPA